MGDVVQRAVHGGHEFVGAVEHLVEEGDEFGEFRAAVGGGDTLLEIAGVDDVLGGRGHGAERAHGAVGEEGATEDAEEENGGDDADEDGLEVGEEGGVGVGGVADLECDIGGDFA